MKSSITDINAATKRIREPNFFLKLQSCPSFNQDEITPSSLSMMYARCFHLCGRCVFCSGCPGTAARSSSICFLRVQTFRYNCLFLSPIFACMGNVVVLLFFMRLSVVCLWAHNNH